MQESEVFTENEITSMYKSIGENVKKYREQKGMSQLQLSNAMGYRSVSLVSAAELCNDGKHFNLEHIYKIAKILDIEMCKLINT